MNGRLEAVIALCLSICACESNVTPTAPASDPPSAKASTALPTVTLEDGTALDFQVWDDSVVVVQTGGTRDLLHDERGAQIHPVELYRSVSRDPVPAELAKFDREWKWKEARSGSVHSAPISLARPKAPDETVDRVLCTRVGTSSFCKVVPDPCSPAWFDNYNQDLVAMCVTGNLAFTDIATVQFHQCLNNIPISQDFGASGLTWDEGYLCPYQADPNATLTITRDSDYGSQGTFSAPSGVLIHWAGYNFCIAPFEFVCRTFHSFDARITGAYGLLQQAWDLN